MTIETIEQTTIEDQQSPRGSGSIVLGAILVTLGGLWLLNILDILEMRWAVVLPVLLALLGLVLIVRSFQAPQMGLVLVGVVVALLTVAAAVTPEGAFAGGIGERNITVTQQSDLEARYDIGVGQIRLNLSDLVMTESTTVTVSVGAGDMRITLPANVAVHIEASAGAGEIRILDQRVNGLSRELSYTTPGFDTASVGLTLKLSVAAGSIEVRR